MDTLYKLSEDPYADVRIAVACNANAPIDILETLSNDKDADVRYSLAENPLLPASILEKLADDENPYVTYRARKTLADLEQEMARQSNFRPVLQLMVLKTSRIIAAI
jgi:hypothetical protein